MTRQSTLKKILLASILYGILITYTFSQKQEQNDDKGIHIELIWSNYNVSEMAKSESNFKLQYKKSDAALHYIQYHKNKLNREKIDVCSHDIDLKEQNKIIHLDTSPPYQIRLKNTKPALIAYNDTVIITVKNNTGDIIKHLKVWRETKPEKSIINVENVLKGQIRYTFWNAGCLCEKYDNPILIEITQESKKTTLFTIVPNVK